LDKNWYNFTICGDCEGNVSIKMAL